MYPNHRKEGAFLFSRDPDNGSFGLSDDQLGSIDRKHTQHPMEEDTEGTRRHLDRGPAPGDEIVEAAINGGARKALKRDEAAFQSGRIKIPFPLSVFATSLKRKGGHQSP